MYHHFFGLKERPFQLVPNPGYLYLSKSHEEALAHLKYAIFNGEGFVELTGEVGTGKTTICRTFLEELGETTEIAYIFNPALSAVELLKAINDEFEIDASADTTKELIDRLNVFLLKKNTENRKVILLIDEAQNLKKDVLEQLRLLSNLETSTQKLLHIILVGQPELSELLHSYDLRQLAQRVTLSCQLHPLTKKETIDYILHRINIAATTLNLEITQGAFKKIFLYSGGTPRLINILCDRAFLVAYAHNTHKINEKIIRIALKEIEKRQALANQTPKSGHRATYYALLVLCMLLILYIAYYPDISEFIQIYYG